MGQSLSEQIEVASSPALIISDSVSHHALTFGNYFREVLVGKGLSQEAFARASGAVGPHVNLICNGKRTPPLDRLDAWVDVLDLKGAQRRWFKLLAGLAHIPDPEVRELVANELAGLSAQAEKQAEQIAALSQRMAELERKK